MAKRKENILDDVVKLSAYFHWAVGVSLAVVSYFVLHWYVGQEFDVKPGIENISGNMLSGILHGFAVGGQYILPILLLIGALSSFIKRNKRNNIYKNAKDNKAGNAIANMTWQEFELLIGEHFRREGYHVRETANGVDGGIDLVLKKNESMYFVQCKHWKAYKVGVKVVREFLGVMVGKGAAGGYVVTSGQFTQDAMKFAVENNIQLIDGKKLNHIILNTPQPPTSKRQKADLSCPKCGSKMVKRTAKKGSRAGEQFWGCSSFPKCRTTLPLNN